jgi:hypothetical protein
MKNQNQNQNEIENRKVRMQPIVNPEHDGRIYRRVMRSALHDIIERIHDQETIEYAKKCFDKMNESDIVITEAQAKQFICNRALTILVMNTLAPNNIDNRR